MIFSLNIMVSFILLGASRMLRRCAATEVGQKISVRSVAKLHINCLHFEHQAEEKNTRTNSTQSRQQLLRKLCAKFCKTSMGNCTQKFVSLASSLTFSLPHFFVFFYNLSYVTQVNCFCERSKLGSQIKFGCFSDISTCVFKQNWHFQKVIKGAKSFSDCTGWSFLSLLMHRHHNFFKINTWSPESDVSKFYFCICTLS